MWMDITNVLDHQKSQVTHRRTAKDINCNSSQKETISMCSINQMNLHSTDMVLFE